MARAHVVAFVRGMTRMVGAQGAAGASMVLRGTSPRVRRLSSKDAALMYASARVPSPVDAVARLVRWAVDAGATRIEVVADRGGAWVRVADDAARTAARDASAPIGLIAAVARVDVWTWPGVEHRGLDHVTIDGEDEPSSPSPSLSPHHPQGGRGAWETYEGGWRRTVVQASAFYARQPVRRKLVRAESVAGRLLGAIRERVVREALGAPRVGFVVRDAALPSAPVLLLKAGQPVEARLRACLGSAASASLAPVPSSVPSTRGVVCVFGHASRVAAAASAAETPSPPPMTAPVQLLYVNGKSVEVRTAAHRVLDRAYARALGAADAGGKAAVSGALRNAKPCYVLHVTLPEGAGDDCDAASRATDIALGALHWEPILVALANVLRAPWGLPPGPLGTDVVGGGGRAAADFSAFTCTAAGPPGSPGVDKATATSRAVRPSLGATKRRFTEEDKAAAQGLRAYFRVKRRHLEEHGEGAGANVLRPLPPPPPLDGARGDKDGTLAPKEEEDLPPSVSIPCWARWLGLTRLARADVMRLELVGQVANQVLVARLPPTSRGAGPRLVAVDQHAADERVRLDTLSKKWRAAEAGGALRAAETLDRPLELSLGPAERDLASRYRRQLAGWGFTHEEVSSGDGARGIHGSGDEGLPSTRFLLTGCPRVEGTLLSVQDFVAFLHALGETLGNADPPALLREQQRAACRGAVMFGDALEPREGAALLQRLSCADLPFQCAHGRPTLAPLADLSRPPAPHLMQGSPWREDLAPSQRAVLRLARGPPEGPPSPEPSQGSDCVEPSDVDVREERAMMRYLATLSAGHP